MTDEKMTLALLVEARNIAATVALDLQRFGSTTLVDTKALSRVATALLKHVEQITRERDEASAINVGALRAQLCAVAGRYREISGPYEVEAVLGISANEPGTDFGRALRDALALAQVRVSYTDDGNGLLCHDLLQSITVKGDEHHHR